MKFLVVLIIIVAVILIIPLFVKKTYSVKRSIVINKSKADVFHYIMFLKNQNNFSKWATMDPGMKTSFTGTDGTPGFVSAWDSDKKDVGKGEQTIQEVVENSKLVTQLHFIKPFEGQALATMTCEEAGAGQTRVTWNIDSSMAYPMNGMLLFLNMDKMIGNDLDIGLNNLKTIMEKQ